MEEAAEGKRHWKDIDIVALKNVYLPAEDSELLAGAAAKFAHGRVLEIGCGCALASLVCATKKEVTRVVATDISAEAIKCAKKNAKRQKAKIEFYRGDLFSALPKKIGKFDTILFNPPYLPTEGKGRGEVKSEIALDGGKEGIGVPSRFISGVGKFLAPGGNALLVASSAQNTKKLEKLSAANGYELEVVGVESLFFEKLWVWKMKRGKYGKL